MYFMASQISWSCRLSSTTLRHCPMLLLFCQVYGSSMFKETACWCDQIIRPILLHWHSMHKATHWSVTVPSAGCICWCGLTLLHLSTLTPLVCGTCTCCEYCSCPSSPEWSATMVTVRKSNIRWCNYLHYHWLFFIGKMNPSSMLCIIDQRLTTYWNENNKKN